MFQRRRLANCMLNKLTSPYAVEVNWKTDLLKIGGIALVIPLFLVTFQPFGIFQGVDIGDAKTIAAIFGFGAIFGVVTLLFWVVLPTLFHRLFESLILWQVIVFFLIFLLVLASTIYFYVYALQEQYDFVWKNYLIVLMRTFLITVIPSCVMVFYKHNSRLKSHLREATALNKKLQSQHLSEEVTLTSENRNEALKLSSETFLYAESADNYCLIHFLQNGEANKEIFRITLKRVETELRPLSRVIRCHRSYIVNMAIVTKVEGNSRGLLLSLENVEQTIPVSRNYIGDVRASIDFQ